MFFRRSLHSRRHKRILYLLFLLSALLLFIIDTRYLLTHPPPTPHISLASSKPQTPQRIFIASIHWNNEQILRSHWNAAVLDLVKHLGPENVFVSILESGSWDDTKGALRDLDIQLAELNVQRSIVLENVTHKDEISRVPSDDEKGWIITSTGRKELRRIPYLSRLRNRVMRELPKAVETTSNPFGKVLWLNDVVFTVDDITTLLATNNGTYASACSLDFSTPPLYYDTFALRDITGSKTATQTWPYFSPSSSSNSHKAILQNMPVRVQSCWNGIVAMDAAPFHGLRPLLFRALDDPLAQKHFEASECCLIHADNPLSGEKGVWLNPNVRVGYSEEAYKAVNTGVAGWPAGNQRLIGLWKARLATVPAIWRRNAEKRLIELGLKRWKAEREHRDSGEESHEERGVHCIVNESQILAENGWKHV